VITVSGTGWTASETISSVTVGGTTATNTLSVTSGALAGSITVPAGLTPAGGAKNIVITGATSGAQGFTGAFTVTATATFTPNTGPAGTVISTVTGTGWYPSETISNTTGVTVGGVAATSSLTVNGSGVLSGSITVPSSLTNGIKTIIITGSSSGAQTFSAAFNVTATATINLAQGWNLISLPLVPNDPTIANMIPSNVQAQMTAPYGQIVDLTYLSGGAAAPTWRWWTPGWGGSTFSTMDDGKAYWIYVNQACSFTVTGTACGAASPGAVPPPRAYWMYYSTSYPDGWNLLGFKSSQTSVKASDYLVSLPGGTYSPLLYRYDGAWVSVSASDNLTPGAGYYIRMYSNGSVMPPCN